MHRIEISRAIETDRPREVVHGYVSDPRNDPRWCPKVRSVEAVDGEGSFEVVHRPIPLRPARRMRHQLLDATPNMLRWREDDGTDLVYVTYEIEDLGPGRVRFTQRTEARLGAPRVLWPMMRIGIGRDVMGQLERLRDVLEARGNGGADPAL